MTQPRVLMVTGAYCPELSGAGLQCRQLIGSLRDRVDFTVLTTAIDPSLPAHDEVDGVPVRRVLVDAARSATKLAAALRMASFVGLGAPFDLFHLHGFSQKSILLVALARLLRRPVLIKLTSVGHDDPLTMRRAGGLAYAAFSRADRFVGVSPRFAALYGEAALPAGRFHEIPNGVDLERFRPADAARRAARRQELGLRTDLKLTLFVGFFSPEKCPDLLFDAWLDTVAAVPDAGLVLIGPSRSPYYEIDPRMAERIRETAAARGLSDRLYFVERTDSIERFYQAADCFALPSSREGMPNAVLEAMACGLPCVVSRLEGVTDALIDDGISGLLVPAGDRAALSAALRRVFEAPAWAASLGAAARARVASRYAMATVADRYAELYAEMTSTREAARR
jgi:glycosyltransferase involved in cell wall biosynthesis